MIAYCGIICNECPSYKGTITGDETLLAKMNEEFGNEKTDAIDFVCLGCKYGDVRLIATDGAACAIRCVRRRKARISARLCDEYENLRTP